MDVHDNLENLADRFNKGDQGAFYGIWDSYYPALCYFAERIVGIRDEAQDIVADCFTKLWMKKGHFPTILAIKAYLYISTRNACLDFLKQNKRNERQRDEFGYSLEQSEESTLAGIAKAELLREVHAAMEKLPRQCRKVVRMSFVDGMKNMEIAKALGLSVQTVKNQKVRGIYLLKMQLTAGNALLLMLLQTKLE